METPLESRRHSAIEAADHLPPNHASRNDCQQVRCSRRRLQGASIHVRKRILEKKPTQGIRRMDPVASSLRHALHIQLNVIRRARDWPLHVEVNPTSYSNPSKPPAGQHGSGKMWEIDARMSCPDASNNCPVTGSDEPATSESLEPLMVAIRRCQKDSP